MAHGGPPGGGDKPPGKFELQEFGNDLHALKTAAQKADDQGKEWAYVLIVYKEQH